MTQLKKIIFMPLQVYYVGDVKVSWPPNNLLPIDDLKSLFLTNKYYKLPDFGREVEMVLGVEINRASRSSDYPHTKRSKYIKDLVQKHGMEECISASVPMTECRIEESTGWLYL